MSKSVDTSQKNDHADIHEGLTEVAVRRLRRLLPRSREIGRVIGDDVAIAALSCFGALEQDHAELQEQFTEAFQAATALVADSKLMMRLHDGHCTSLVLVSDRAFLAGFYAGVAVKDGAR